MTKEYSSQELNKMIGYEDLSGTNSSKKDIMTRCKNAGLILKDLPTKRGLPNKYIIIEDNFHKEGEIWIDCYCDSNLEVSNFGRVRKKRTKKLLGYTEGEGYPSTNVINADGKQVRRSIHRLVYFSFHPELIKDEKHIQIDHINGIRTDARLDNLRALTSIENTKARDKHQTVIKSLQTELITIIGYDKLEEYLLNLLDEVKKNE